MAKRLSDTDKWKKPFIRALPAEYKLFWLYILDDCDHAGVWHVDIEVAELRLGIKLSIEKARGFFSGKMVEFDNETKWFVPDFITFQYGEFNEANKMYKAIIPILNKYNLIPHISPIYGVKVKVMDKVMVMDKDKGGMGEKKYSIEHCTGIALRDERWIDANKTNESELKDFNLYLEKQGVYDFNPMDYKRYFSHWKPKKLNPETIKLKPWKIKTS